MLSEFVCDICGKPFTKQLGKGLGRPPKRCSAECRAEAARRKASTWHSGNPLPKKERPKKYVGQSCSVDGCEMIASRKGDLCTAHYQRVRAYGTTDPVRAKCAECGAATRMPPSENRVTLCVDHRSITFWRKHNPEQAKVNRERERARLYGLTVEEMRSLLARDRCDICGTSEPGGRGDWHVDHDHKTGRARGVLCMSCNHAVGKFEKHSDAIMAYLAS